MARVINFTNDSFEYKITLQDSALQIVAKHVDDCYIWSTIIENVLNEPDTVINPPQTKFIVNLDPEEIFEIFYHFNEKSLDNGITLTFPTLYKNSREHILITINVKLSLGKQHNNTQWIILEPEDIANDDIIFQKLINLNNKMDSKFMNLENSITTVETNIVQQILPQEMEKFKKIFSSEIQEIEPKLINLITSLTNTIFNVADEKYQTKMTDEGINLLTNEIMNAFQIRTSDIFNNLDKKINDLTKLSQELDKKYFTKIEQLDKKYANKFEQLENKINASQIFT